MIGAGGITNESMADVLAKFSDMAEAAALKADGVAVEQRGMLPFIEADLGSPLWGKQREIVDSVQNHPRTAVRSCHAAGKSHTGARLALAYVEQNPHSIVVTTAPTSRQVRNVLWRSMRAVYAPNKDKMRGRMLTERYEISADWYALGFKGSDNNSDAVQGFHAENMLVIVDEAAGVAESVMEGLEAILTGTGARLLLIGNPTSMSGSFRRAFHEDRELYNTITISAYDTPNFTKFGITREDMVNDTWRDKVTGSYPYPALIDPGWVERQYLRHGPDSAFCVSRIDAEFPSDDDSVLFSLSDIEAAMASEEAPDPRHDKYVGIDVARQGSDETAICLRQGPAETYFDSWQGFDLMESIGKVRSILQDHGYEDAEIRIDATGMGEGFADRMQELGYNVVPVRVGSASSDKAAWRNFRHEAWWQLKELYRERLIWPAPGHEFDPAMIAQLTDIRMRYESNYTKPVIEDKDMTKKRTGRSPDRAEAQLLAYCTLPKAPRKRKRRKPTKAITVYGKTRGWHRYV